MKILKDNFSTKMPTGHPILESPSLGHSYKVMLDYAKFTITIDYHTGVQNFERITRRDSSNIYCVRRAF